MKQTPKQIETDLSDFILKGLSPPISMTEDSTYLSCVETVIRDLPSSSVDPTIIDRIEDTYFAAGLTDYCERTGEKLEDFLKNSIAFRGLPTTGETIHEPRHSLASLDIRAIEDSGYKVDLEALKSIGIDPEKVLYFRATQPSTDSAKPESFWTSDLSEVYRGLKYELGAFEITAIILVSTLGEISKDSELMTDKNDDNGHPVRRIADTPFEQSRALFAMHRLEAKRHTEGHFFPNLKATKDRPNTKNEPSLNLVGAEIDFVDDDVSL